MIRYTKVKIKKNWVVNIFLSGNFYIEMAVILTLRLVEYQKHIFCIRNKKNNF